MHTCISWSIKGFIGFNLLRDMAKSMQTFTDRSTHTHTNIHTHTQTHSPVNTPKSQHLQINPTNSTATAAELHHIQPTLEISKVLMMKSVYLAVSTMRTLTSPYFMVPSSGQYCSHFFCKTHHDHQVTKSNFPLQGPTYSHVSKHWYSCNACDF